jgi:hypothetical protein
MIPYLIRRAQESRKMLSSNRLQSALLMDEIIYMQKKHTILNTYDLSINFFVKNLI